MPSVTNIYKHIDAVSGTGGFGFHSWLFLIFHQIQVDILFHMKALINRIRNKMRKVVNFFVPRPPEKSFYSTEEISSYP